MNTLKTITTIFLLLILSGCKKDPPIQTGTNELYTPYLTSIRNNGKVTLKWGKPMCPWGCPGLDPEHFDILISNTNPSELEVHATVSNNIFEVTINNLTNGIPYYFAIKAIGHNEPFTVSNTIMTIPDNSENIQSLFQTINENREFGTWLPDQSSVAYVSDYTWNNGKYSAKSVFVSALSINKKRLIEKSSSSPEWSPTGQKIVYHTDNAFLAHIAVYNIADSSIKRLTSGNSFNFLPTWSPDGKWIAFLSDKAGGNEYNIWKIPADSGAAIQITSDFNDLKPVIIDDHSPRKLSWSKDGINIAFSLKTKLNNGYVNDIFSVPSSGGNKSIIVSSQWYDFCPAYSPDGMTIAFVSNRSGLNEIWTMNLQTKKLRQITGSTGQWIHVNPGTIEWSASGNKILFTGIANDFFTLYTVDIN